MNCSFHTLILFLLRCTAVLREVWVIRIMFPAELKWHVLHRRHMNTQKLCIIELRVDLKYLSFRWNPPPESLWDCSCDMWPDSSSSCRVATIDFPIFFSPSITPSRDCLTHWLGWCVFVHVLLFDYRSFRILVKIQTLFPSDRRSNRHRDSMTQSNTQAAAGAQPRVSTSPRPGVETVLT